MTLSIAWVRQIKDCEELWIASDSRLAGGMRWDECPKIILLPRSDAAIAFAGDTSYAYPLMLQLSYAIASHTRSSDGAMDIHDLKGHLLHLFRSLKTGVTALPTGDLGPDVQFLFCGYSWIQKTFALWRIHYNTVRKDFDAYSAGDFFHGLRKIAFAGDWADYAKKRLITLLRARYGDNCERLTPRAFGMEPFEVLRDTFREKSGDMACSIGGPPQVVKIYQHMNARPLAVKWTVGDMPRITVLGRALLDYENTDLWILDPDTFKTTRQPRAGKQEEAQP